jgi:twitching motility protein PilJ
MNFNLLLSTLRKKANWLNVGLVVIFFIISLVGLWLITSGMYTLLAPLEPLHLAILSTVALILTLFFALKIGLAPVDDMKAALDEMELDNRNNQDAILRLLDEMGDLADGDLTVSATVTEDMTGAIADSVNYTIDALRTLVEQINSTTEEVAGAAQETQATALHLIDASEHQSQQITDVSSAITEMAASIEEVSNNATQSSEVAKQSVTLAVQGNTAVKKAINGMETIREQIQETSKRIKRLGESSQQIGDIVELINDIAEQTNILSLNAAIQAAMAGEAGRGFAVVADEVQRLAERSSNATRQIDALVKTIQSDTSEAIASMEQSTSGVVSGAQLSQDAGTSLEQIEAVSHQLAELINNITANTKQQAMAAVSTSESMNVIQEITMQTSTGTNESAAAIGRLLELTNELRKSISGFTLPE